MTSSDRAAPADGAPPKPSIVARVRHRAEAVGARMVADRRVRRVQGILDLFGVAGGGIVSAGLAFTALFAILPGLLLMVGLTGLWANTPENRIAFIEAVVSRIPPLAGFLGDNLDELVGASGAFSIVGAVGLLWGASSFYGVLDESMARIFSANKRRGLVEQRIRGVVVVVAMVAAALTAVGFSAVWSYVEQAIVLDEQIVLWRFISPTVTVLVFIVATLLTYQFIPTEPPGWRAAGLPAVVAGLGIGILTGIFGQATAALIGGLRAFGAIAAVFGVLIWLNYVFQILLIGAAWSRVRRDERQAAGISPWRAAGERLETPPV